MLLREDRRNQIYMQALRQGAVKVRELTERFSVSYETIRSDLAYLEDQGLLVKSHGGAILKQTSIENPFNVRQEENASLKQAVAQKAAELIPDGARILLGTGSTVLELAKLLVLRNDLKIFTDSLPAAMYLLNSENEIYLFGGKLRQMSSSVYGGWTKRLINEIHVNICFIGTDGFSKANGPTTPSYSDAAVDQEILHQSDRKYVLCDYTKFTRDSLYEVTPWTNVTGIITNKEIDSKLKEKIEHKTKVILA